MVTSLEQIINEDDKCPNNSLHEYIKSNGFNVCIHCGLINGQSINNNQLSKTRAYTNQEYVKKVFRESISDQLIGPRTQMGSKMDQLTRQQKRLNKINRSLVNDERNYFDTQNYFNKIKNLFPKHIIDNAWLIYKKCKKKGLLKGRSIADFVTASTYLSIKINKKPLLINDYLVIVRNHGLLTNLSKLNSIINLIKDENIVSEVNLDLVYFIQPYFEKGLSKLISDEIKNKHYLIYSLIKRATTIYLYTPKIMLGGTSPSGCIAGLMYEGCKHYKLKISQNKIVNELNVTEVTLRHRYRDFRKVSLRLNFLDHK